MDKTLRAVGLDVSRETLASLAAFAELVEKWTKTINLVSPGTIDQLWSRHICDSAQVFPHLDRSRGHVLDMGSGGGFPGVVLAIMAREFAPELRFTFVESDQRKAVFLRQCVRSFSLSATVKAQRIEALDHASADIVTARAFTALDGLIELSLKHLKPEGIALFLKGKSAQSELVAARDQFKFNVDLIPSKTSDQSCLLKLKDISRV